MLIVQDSNQEVKKEITEIKEIQAKKINTIDDSVSSQKNDSFRHGFFVQPTVLLSRFIFLPTNPGMNLSLGWKYRGSQAGVQLGAQAEVAGVTHIGAGPKVSLTLENSGRNRFSSSHVSFGLLFATGLSDAITRFGDLYYLPNFNVAFLFRPKKDRLPSNQQFLFGPSFGANVFIDSNKSLFYFQYQLGLVLYFSVYGKNP